MCIFDIHFSFYPAVLCNWLWFIYCFLLFIFQVPTHCSECSHSNLKICRVPSQTVWCSPAPIAEAGAVSSELLVPPFQIFGMHLADALHAAETTPPVWGKFLKLDADILCLSQQGLGHDIKVSDMWGTICLECNAHTMVPQP